jgi:hypothetical protein
MFKKVILATLVASALAVSASASALPVTSTTLDRLCYVAAEDAPVAYNAEAKRYGVSKLQLRKLERSVKCDGVPLGKVVNNWIKRNPS